MTALAVLIVLGPLAGPAAAIAGARARLAGIAQAAGAVIAFGCSLALLVMLDGRAPLFGWDGFLYVDSLGAFFLMTVAGVTLLAALGSIGYVSAQEDGGELSGFQVRLYFSFFGLFASLMLAALETGNLGLALSRAARTVTGVALGPLLLPGKLTVIPAHKDFSAFSPTYLAIFLVAGCAVPALIYLAGRPRAASVSVPVWDGGMVSFRPRMQYSAMTFSAPTRVTFDALYRPSVSVRRASDDDPAGRSGPVHYEAQVTPVFERYLYRPVIRAVEWLADAIRPLQSGDVNLYLLYVFAMILLAYLLGAV